MNRTTHRMFGRVLVWAGILPREALSLGDQLEDIVQKFFLCEKALQEAIQNRWIHKQCVLQKECEYLRRQYHFRKAELNQLIHNAS